MVSLNSGQQHSVAHESVCGKPGLVEAILDANRNRVLVMVQSG